MLFPVPYAISADELYSSDVTTLYSMPDHHIPTGFTMDNDTRRMVLEWAYKSDNRYIIEDSYDSFYQYGDKRLAPLFSMDTMGRVIYLCSFARILSSAIRVSFIVLPDSLVRRWSKTHRFYRCLASRLEQAIILEFISRGYLHKQIVTMKEIYKAKRDFLTDRLMHSALANNIKIINADAGTHFLINYRSACTQVQLVEKAKNSGIKILPLSHYFIDEVSNRYNDNIFVMGFGGMSELEMTDAVRLLEQAWTK